LVYNHSYEQIGVIIMPQESNGDLYTGMGIKIKLEDLIAQFTFFGKTYPIGKFDPAEYPTMQSEKSWPQLGQEILNQLDDSKFWSVDELITIAMMNQQDFLLCINPLQPGWDDPSLYI